MHRREEKMRGEVVWHSIEYSQRYWEKSGCAIARTTNRGCGGHLAFPWTVDRPMRLMSDGRFEARSMAQASSCPCHGFMSVQENRSGEITTNWIAIQPD